MNYDELKTNGEHSYGCAMLRLPDVLAAAVRQVAARIADEDLAEDGREIDPHVTALYGFTGKPSRVISRLRLIVGELPPVKIELGKTTLFKNADKGYDVVKIAVKKTPSLLALRKWLLRFPNENKYPDYEPHVTLAYVKPGTGDKYCVWNGLEGETADVSVLTYSDQDGEETGLSFDVENKKGHVTAFRVVPQVVAFRVNFDPKQLRDREGKWTSGRHGAGKTRWDARDGIGAVPMNQEVAYRGFVKSIFPEQFRQLVPPGVSGPGTKEYVKQALREGKTLGQPFLTVKWLEDEKAWQVIDHEGRSRADAVAEVHPNDRLPVHIFPIGLRARDLTEEMLAAPFYRQRPDGWKINMAENQPRDEDGKWTSGGFSKRLEAAWGSTTRLPKDRGHGFMTAQGRYIQSSDHNDTHLSMLQKGVDVEWQQDGEGLYNKAYNDKMIRFESLMGSVEMTGVPTAKQWEQLPVLFYNTLTKSGDFLIDAYKTPAARNEYPLQHLWIRVKRDAEVDGVMEQLRSYYASAEKKYASPLERFRNNMADDQPRDKDGKWTDGGSTPDWADDGVTLAKKMIKEFDVSDSIWRNTSNIHRGYLLPNGQLANRQGMFHHEMLTRVLDKSQVEATEGSMAAVSEIAEKNGLIRYDVDGLAEDEIEPYVSLGKEPTRNQCSIIESLIRESFSRGKTSFTIDATRPHNGTYELYYKQIKPRDNVKQEVAAMASFYTAPVAVYKSPLAQFRNNAVDENGVEGRWVTMHGTPVFIKDGEDPKEAMGRTFDKDKPRGLDRPTPKQPGAFKRWFKEMVSDYRRLGELKRAEKQGNAQQPVRLKERERDAASRLQKIGDVALGNKETVAGRLFAKHVEAVYNGTTTPEKMVDSLIKSGQIKTGTDDPAKVRERAVADFKKAVQLREDRDEANLKAGAGRKAYTDKGERATLAKGESLAERHWAGHIDQLMDGKMSVTAKVDELIGKGEMGFQRGDKGYLKMRETAIKDFTRAVNRREATDMKMERERAKSTASAGKPLSARAQKKADAEHARSVAFPTEEELKGNAFDPNQPRDTDGKWTGGSLNFTGEPSKVGAFTKDVAIRRSTTTGAEWNLSVKMTWHNPDGSAVTDPKMLERIAQLKGTKATLPGYKGAWVNPDLSSPLLALAFASNGKTQYVYDKDFEKGNMAHKFDVVKEMQKDLPGMQKRAAADRKAGNVNGFLFKLLDITCMRISSDDETHAKVKSYGLSNLQSRHVTVSGDTVKLDFVAKGGHDQSYKVVDRELARFMAARKEKAGEGEAKLWPETNNTKFNAYLRKINGEGSSEVTAHKFRSYHATMLATDELAQHAGKEMSAKEFSAVQKDICEKAAALLHNTWGVCRNKYIDPTCWSVITVRG